MGELIIIVFSLVYSVCIVDLGQVFVVSFSGANNLISKKKPSKKKQATADPAPPTTGM